MANIETLKVDMPRLTMRLELKVPKFFSTRVKLLAYGMKALVWALRLNVTVEIKADQTA